VLERLVAVQPVSIVKKYYMGIPPWFMAMFLLTYFVNSSINNGRILILVLPMADGHQVCCIRCHTNLAVVFGYRKLEHRQMNAEYPKPIP